MKSFLIALAILVAQCLGAEAGLQVFTLDATSSGSPTIAFTALNNAAVSSTTTGSGTYTVAAPSGLTSATYGGGCSGSSTVSGFSASGGTWSATFTTPATACTGTLSVTGTGSNTASAISPNATFSTSGNVAFTPNHLFFVSPTGLDTNSGTSTTSAWLSPNHAVDCGDVLLASPGDYSTSAVTDGNFSNTFGVVSNCPSTSGGIDGTGGINFAILLCAGSDLGTGSNACHINADSGAFNTTSIMSVSNSNWAIEGWVIVNGISGCPTSTNPCNRAFEVYACPTGDGGNNAVVHHVAFINNLTSEMATGFTTDDCGSSGGHNTFGGDYWAAVGNIAQNSAQDTQCLGAIDSAGQGVHDTNAGTHQFMYGNFSYANANTVCATISDTEGFMYDTASSHLAGYQQVMINNIGFDSERMCMQVTDGNSNLGATYFLDHNTCFRNNVDNNTAHDNLNGDININGGSNSINWSITLTNNIAYQPLANSNGVSVAAFMNFFSFDGTSGVLTNGQSGTQNVYMANNTSCDAMFCDSTFSAESNGESSDIGTNFFQNPSFTNTTDLLDNQLGVPNCTGFPTTTACMGWNPVTQVLTTPSIISDLQAGCADCSGKGFQLPSTTCVSSGTLFNLWPSMLKGVVRLAASGFANGATITENPDLVTKPCGQ